MKLRAFATLAVVACCASSVHAVTMDDVQQMDVTQFNDVFGKLSAETQERLLQSALTTMREENPAALLNICAGLAHVSDKFANIAMDVANAPEFELGAKVFFTDGSGAAIITCVDVDQSYQTTYTVRTYDLSEIDGLDGEALDLADPSWQFEMNDIVYHRTSGSLEFQVTSIHQDDVQGYLYGVVALEDSEDYFDDVPEADLRYNEFEYDDNEDDDKSCESNENMETGVRLVFADAVTGDVVSVVGQYDTLEEAQGLYATRNFRVRGIFVNARAGNVLELQHDGIIVATSADADQKKARHAYLNPNDPCTPTVEGGWLNQADFDKGGDAYDFYANGPPECIYDFDPPDGIHISLAWNAQVVQQIATRAEAAGLDPVVATGFGDGDGSVNCNTRFPNRVLGEDYSDKPNPNAVPGHCVDYYDAASDTYNFPPKQYVSLNFRYELSQKCGRDGGDPMAVDTVAYMATRMQTSVSIRRKVSKASGKKITVCATSGGGANAANLVMSEIGKGLTKNEERHATQLWWAATGLGHGTQSGGNKHFLRDFNQGEWDVKNSARCEMIEAITAAHDKDRATNTLDFYNDCWNKDEEDEWTDEHKAKWLGGMKGADGGGYIKKSGLYETMLYQSNWFALNSIVLMFKPLGFEFHVGQAKKTYDGDFEKNREAYTMYLRGGRAKVVEFARLMVGVLPSHWEKTKRYQIMIDFENDPAGAYAAYRKLRGDRKNAIDVLFEED